MVKFKDADHITLWSLILDWAVNAKVRGKKAGNDLGGCDDDCTQKKKIYTHSLAMQSILSSNSILAANAKQEQKGS